MSQASEQLATSIHGLLASSPTPLKTREVVDALRGRGCGATKSAVNAALFGELSFQGLVALDGDYRWRALHNHPGGGAAASHAGQGSAEAYGAHAGAAPDASPTAPEDRRAARRVLQTLRSGTSSCRAARAISVGTDEVEQELLAKVEALSKGGAKDDAVVIAADWGFGKSHLRMLLSGHLADRGTPFVYECIDARAASLAHIHRSVPRWLERLRIGPTLGLRDAIQNGTIPADKATRWAGQNHSGFAHGLRWALGGNEYGWLYALGHPFRSPDYPYQHPKAWAVLDSAATFLNRVGRGGLVLLLDEAENIDKQYDVRGRRKSYDTLARMMRHPHMLPVVLVTDRLLYQVAEDHAHGHRHGWANWTPEAKWFVTRFREIAPTRPPHLTDRLAEQLAANIAGLHRLAYRPAGHGPSRQVLSHWRKTPTRSVRLLVRLMINELDLGIQDGAATPG